MNASRSLCQEHITSHHKVDRRAEKFLKKGMYKRAEPVMKRSLSYKEKMVGPDTPEVAVSLNNLAIGRDELFDVTRVP